jgi:hypothetical protein
MGATEELCRSSAVSGRKAWSHFNRTVLLLSLGAMLLLVGSNLVVDPYSVFGSPLFRDGPQLNERVVKFQHLSRQLRPVDVVLTGSSVMGVIPPDAVAPGRSSFNLSFFSATPAHIQQMLQALERIDRLPSVIVVGIDPFMLSAPNLRSAQMRLPPEASGARPLDFWREFLLAGDPGAAIGKVFDHFTGSPGVQFDRPTGAYRLAIYDASIEHDHAAHIRKRFAGPAWKAQRPDLTPGFGELEALAAWLRERRGVRTVWVLQPLHRLMRIALGETTTTYRHRVLTIVGNDAIDLTDQPMTADDRLWYEPKHYRPEAATLIAAPISSAISPTTNRVATLQ